MDAAWNFRRAYAEARKVMEKQDCFCRDLDARVNAKSRSPSLWSWIWMAGEKEAEWGCEDEFPESLQWESLVDVLRGRVKVCRCFF
jgi:hypothetical protein